MPRSVHDRFFSLRCRSDVVAARFGLVRPNAKPPGGKDNRSNIGLLMDALDNHVPHTIRRGRGWEMLRIRLSWKLKTASSRFRPCNLSAPFVLGVWRACAAQDRFRHWSDRACLVFG